MKKSYSLLEIIFVLVLVSILLIFAISKPMKHSNLNLAVEKIILYLNFTRYIAHIDNKMDIDDNEWEMKRWTMKFQRCKDTDDGLYISVYSDMSGNTTHFKKTECLKDPMSNKYLYSNNDCVVSDDESKYVLLTKEYGVKKVEISCNTSSSIGQISFGFDGKIYSKLGNNEQEIKETCSIKLYDNNQNMKEIFVEPKTGYIYN